MMNANKKIRPRQKIQKGKNVDPITLSEVLKKTQLNPKVKMPNA